MSKILAKQSRNVFYPVFICCLASLFYFYDYFIQVAPGIMTQQLMRSFSIGAGALGVLSACFYYSYTLMQIPAGMLLDRLGVRFLLTLAAFFCAVGSILFAVTHSFAIAGAARFIVGIASSFAFISVLLLISRRFAHRHFGTGAGLVQLSGSLGSIFGLAPFASMVNNMGWRQSMILAGLIAFGLAILFWFFLRDGKPARSKHIITADGEKLRLKHLMQMPQVWWISVCGFMTWVPVAVIGALWGVSYFMKVYGLTNVEAGSLCSLFWVGIGLGSPLVGWISHRLGNRCVPFASCFGLGVVGSLLIVNANIIPLWLVAFALILLGLSSSAQSLSFGILKDNVPPTLFGTASGFNNMAVILGAAVSQPLVGYVLHLSWSGLTEQHLPVYSINDYRIAFCVLPIAAFIGLLVTLCCLKETHCEMQHPAREAVSGF